MSTLVIVGVVLLVLVVAVVAIWLIARATRPSQHEQIEIQHRTELARASWAQHQAEARMNAITDQALRRMVDISSRYRP